MRHSTRYRLNTFFSASNFPQGVKWLLISNTAVFVLGYLLGQAGFPGIFNRWFALVPREVVFHFAIWQLATYLFLHGGVGHLLFNMLALWMFGVTLERDWGTRRFLKYYFLCGIGAGLCDVTVNALLGNWYTSTIGASGAIYGVLLAVAIVMPHRQVWVFPLPVTVSMRIFVIVMGAIEFFGTIGSTGDGVSHVCHLGGMLVGYIYLRRGSHLYNYRNFFTDWKRRRLRKKFEVYVRDHTDKPPSNPDNWVN